MKKFFALCLLFSLFAIPTFAQSKITFHGQVVDDTDAVIPGAKVTLTDANGQARTVVADGSGDYVIPEVAPGLYQLKVEYDSFQPYVKSDLQIAAATASHKVVMTIATVRNEITVSAEDPANTTDPENNMNAIVLDENFVANNLPDNEDDLRRYIEGLVGTGGGGASGGQGGAMIYVDGFSPKRLPSRDSIMQIRVNQNPFSAESPTPGMGRVDIITKPGNDQWRGTFGANFRNSALDARNAFAATKPELGQNRLQFNLGGPLVKKKISFFLNVERRSLEGSNNVNATTLDGLYTANVKAPSNNTSFNIRTDFLLNDRNTLNVSYNRFGNTSLNREFAVRFGGVGGGGGFGGGGFGGGNNLSSGGTYLLPGRGSNSENTNHTLQLSATSIINPKLILESRLRYQREASNTTAVSNGVAINVLDAFNGGGSTCCPNTRQENNLEWQEYLTFTHKKHTVKGGLQFQYGNYDVYNASNFNGTYTFSSLAQYRAVLNGERVDPNDPTSPLVRPTQFTINQGDPQLNFNQYQAAWFVQDDWRIKPTLTLSLGLRHEFQSNVSDKNNFAPRIGIAWSPFKDRKTTIRLGGGIFYSRLTDSLFENTLRYDGIAQQSIVIRNPQWLDPFGGDPTLSPARTIVRTLDPALKTPYTINLMGSVERQLPGGWVSTVTYNYTKGLNQFRARNINAPLPETGLRPDPTQGNIYQIESSAKSEYQGVTFGLQRRLGKLFQVFSNYTYSHTNSNADGAMSLPANNYDLRSEWGPAFTDRRHTAFIGGSINLPKGVRLAPFITASSGSPFNITTGMDNNGDTEINDRPAGISRNSGLPASSYALLPANLQQYLQTYYPNGVNAVGPGSFNVNLNVSKTFSFGKREGGATPAMSGGSGGMGGGMRGGMGGMFGGGGSESGRFNLQLSAQITNLLNKVNYGQYSGVLSSPYFGKSNSAGGARQLEVGLRFSF